MIEFRKWLRTIIVEVRYLHFCCEERSSVSSITLNLKLGPDRPWFRQEGGKVVRLESWFNKSLNRQMYSQRRSLATHGVLGRVTTLFFLEKLVGKRLVSRWQSSLSCTERRFSVDVVPVTSPSITWVCIVTRYGMSWHRYRKKIVLKTTGLVRVWS